MPPRPSVAVGVAVLSIMMTDDIGVGRSELSAPHDVAPLILSRTLHRNQNWGVTSPGERSLVLAV